MTVKEYDIHDVLKFVSERHDKQTYSSFTFVYHLSQVAYQMRRFGYTGLEYQAAAYLHDVIEDTKTTRAEVEERFGPFVTSLVWAVTGIGENRAARNADIHAKLRANPAACVLKAADRIANHAASIADPATGKPRHSLIGLYLKERDDFESLLDGNVPTEVWNELQTQYEMLAELSAQYREEKYGSKSLAR